MNNSAQKTAPLTKRSSVSTDAPMTDELEQTILRALRGLKYGQVTIAVQEGQVTQVDRSEHTRHFRNKRIHG
jgi:hypothetical protein